MKSDDHMGRRAMSDVEAGDMTVAELEAVLSRVEARMPAYAMPEDVARCVCRELAEAGYVGAEDRAVLWMVRRWQRQRRRRWVRGRSR